MSQKKLLLISPTRREYEQLPAIAESLNCEVLFEDFAGDYFDTLLEHPNDGEIESLEILPLIERTIEKYANCKLSGVTSGVGYPGMPVSAVIAERLGLPAPSAKSVLLCEHKYYSRLAQHALVPESTPPFCLIDPRNPEIPSDVAFPLFMKPVKSCFSINANIVSGPDELRRNAMTCLLPEKFLKPLNDMLHAYTDFSLDATYVIAESVLTGSQVSLEGYVSQGIVHVLGIIDAVMYPGTISFKRFEYPSELSEDVQERMKQIAKQFIKGIGYDNALFNIEFIYNSEPDEIHIVEVNPKIASQFTDLFEKVDGHSSYRTLLQVALGENPDFRQREGAFKVAASCVLRTFEDKMVMSVPTREEIDLVVEQFPDVRIEINARAGERLSALMQDGNSFRYGVLNIGAETREALDVKFELCRRSLNFSFGPP